jgi:hypothetical protein
MSQQWRINVNPKIPVAGGANNPLLTKTPVRPPSDQYLPEGINNDRSTAANKDASRQPVGLLTLGVYDFDNGALLEAAFFQFLNRELEGRALDASQLSSIAEDLTKAVSENLSELFDKLPLSQKEDIRRIARQHGMTDREASIEYLANTCLFLMIRDYFELPQRESLLKDDPAGFVLLTRNGSMVSSPPLGGNSQRRTFHYTRMPSRKNAHIQTGAYSGILTDDIQRGSRFSCSAMNASEVHLILYIPPDKAALFEQIRQGSEVASSIVATIIPRG